MVHVPAATRCTVAPVIVQTAVVLLEKLTGRAEVADALTSKSGSLTVLPASAPNTIVWFALLIVNVRLTVCAGLKSAVPACEAVSVQLPATVQLPLATTVTGRPELAVGLTLKSG